MGTVTFRKVDVDGIKVFYREAGPKDAPTSRARVCQCRGWGWRRPARMLVAYGFEMPRADDMAGTVTPARRGRIFWT
jgi:hypothetical protein